MKIIPVLLIMLILVVPVVAQESGGSSGTVLLPTPISGGGGAYIPREPIRIEQPSLLAIIIGFIFSGLMTIIATIVTATFLGLFIGWIVFVAITFYEWLRKEPKPKRRRKK